MSRLRSNVPKCCEDHEGNVLCVHLIGCFCNARQPNVSWIHINRDGLELLQQVGCDLFSAKTQLKQAPTMKESCEYCLLFEGCEFKNDMRGSQCPKFKVNKGVLSQENWT